MMYCDDHYQHAYLPRIAETSSSTTYGARGLGLVTQGSFTLLDRAKLSYTAYLALFFHPPDPPELIPWELSTL